MPGTVIERNARRKKQEAFTDSSRERNLEAIVLLTAEMGLAGIGNPRFPSVVDALEGALAQGRHMKRYEPTEDFDRPGRVFNIHVFWRGFAQAADGAGRLSPPSGQVA